MKKLFLLFLLVLVACAPVTQTPPPATPIPTPIPTDSKPGHILVWELRLAPGEFVYPAHPLFDKKNGKFEPNADIKYFLADGTQLEFLCDNATKMKCVSDVYNLDPALAIDWDKWSYWHVRTGTHKGENVFIKHDGLVGRGVIRNTYSGEIYEPDL